jgi:hypothetical protein
VQNALRVLAQLPALMAASDAGVGPPPVNWRALVALLPSQLGDFAAVGAATGSTRGVGGLQVSTVHRVYHNGAREAQAEIVDTSLHPMLREVFTTMQSVFEDSPNLVRRPVTVGSAPAVLEWHGSSQRSEVQLLVASRYLVKVWIRPATSQDEAVALARQLDLASIAAVR